MDLKSLGLIVGFLLVMGWRFYKVRKFKRELPLFIAQGAIILDVRTPQEYSRGAKEGSRNLPLDRLERECSHLNPHQTILLCCESGTRSAFAARILKKKGFNKVINAGSWRNI